jgi:hypothetical protein
MTSNSTRTRSYLECGKVNNRINPRVLRENLLQRHRIRHIRLVERGPLSADKLDAIKSFLRGVVEIVDHDDVIAGKEELERREGANVACSPVVRSGVALAIAFWARCTVHWRRALIPGY